MLTDTPILTAIDTLSSYETDNVRWLRRAGPIAARLNAEARLDPANEPDALSHLDDAGPDGAAA